MNIVTIKAKAQLAAKEIEYAAGESISCDIASIIESCFTPDPANEANKDLLEALKALKACKEELLSIYEATLEPDPSNTYVEACDELMRDKHRITQRYNRIKKEYGLDKVSYLKLVEDQNSSCKLCNKHIKDHFKLHVDHCHETKRVRGLLCNTCNQGIGLLLHSPELLIKAAAYCEATC